MVHPATLARVVAELGGEIHEYSRVTELDTSGDGVVARTDAGLVGRLAPCWPPTCSRPCSSATGSRPSRSTTTR